MVPVPPRRYSRYSLTSASRPTVGAPLMLHSAPRYLYRKLPDTREHVVVLGDTLQNLAARYFAGLPRPAGLWWVIADFQPEPIHDPTVELEPGRVLHIPSSRILTEEVFSERRRLEEA